MTHDSSVPRAQDMGQPCEHEPCNPTSDFCKSLCKRDCVVEWVKRVLLEYPNEGQEYEEQAKGS